MLRFELFYQPQAINTPSNHPAYVFFIRRRSFLVSTKALYTNTLRSDSTDKESKYQKLWFFLLTTRNLNTMIMKDIFQTPLYQQMPIGN